MEMDWTANELKTVNLNNKRLNERLVEILKNLSKNPNLSIPAACGGHSETMAAYRFFENPKTTIQNILQPHRNATEQRIAEQKVVLFVQDTTVKASIRDAVYASSIIATKTVHIRARPAAKWSRFSLRKRVVLNRVWRSI